VSLREERRSWWEAHSQEQDQVTIKEAICEEGWIQEEAMIG
jgi:hypothetical protein